MAEVLAYGDGKRVAALVQFKPEVIERLEAAVANQIDNAGEILEAIWREVNPCLAAFSRIGRIQIQSEPFEKTPSQNSSASCVPQEGVGRHER